MKIYVNKTKFIEIVKKAATFCSTYDMNNVISGVNIIVDKKEKVLEIAGIDGNMIFYYPLPFEYDSDCSATAKRKIVNIALSPDFIKKIRFKKNYIGSVFIEFKKDKVIFDQLYDFGKIEVKPIEGVYPKYKGLFPDYKKNESKYGFNPELLKKCFNAVSMNGYHNTVTIKENGINGAYVSTDMFHSEGGRVLIMPWQIN